MFKYKKIFLMFLTLFYIIFSIIEFIKYLFVNSNLFGLIYIIMNVIIIFLLIPTSINYRRIYSKASISKLIIVVILGIFSILFLPSVVNVCINYIDESYIYLEKISFIKNILKMIILILLSLFVTIEIYFQYKTKKY